MFPRPSVLYEDGTAAALIKEGHEEGGFARWEMKFSATKRAERVRRADGLDRNFPGDASTRNNTATLRGTLHGPPPGSRPCFY